MKIPWNRKQQPITVFLPGKFHGQRSLAGYSPWGHKESGTTEHICTHSLSHTHPTEKPALPPAQYRLGFLLAKRWCECASSTGLTALAKLRGTWGSGVLLQSDTSVVFQSEVKRRRGRISGFFLLCSSFLPAGCWEGSTSPRGLRHSKWPVISIIGFSDWIQFKEQLVGTDKKGE